MDARAETDAAPYREWAENGYLTPQPGAVIDYEPVALWLKEAMENHGLQHVAYDPHQIAHLIRELEKLGVKSKKAELGKLTPFKQAPSDVLLLHPHPQGPIATGITGLNMTASIELTESAILGKRLHIMHNPCLRSNILGAVIQPRDVGRAFSKMKSMTKIDGCLTTVMAMGMAVALQTQDVGELIQQLRIGSAGSAA